MKITRRGALLTLLAASSATLAARHFPWTLATLSSVEGFLLELLRAVAVPDPVLVGEARLRAEPALKTDPQALFESVFQDLPLETAASPRQVAVALGEKARRQFEAGDVVRAQNWILARVEADLCALVALDGRPGR